MLTQFLGNLSICKAHTYKELTVNFIDVVAKQQTNDL